MKHMLCARFEGEHDHVAKYHAVPASKRLENEAARFTKMCDATVQTNNLPAILYEASLRCREIDVVQPCSPNCRTITRNPPEP